MDQILAELAAAADPTRLRLLALAASGAYCVSDFCDILGQSQPRLSRHLRLLCDAGLLEKLREGANAWFVLAQGEAGRLARQILARLPENEPQLAADRRQAARVLAERARAASASFQNKGADWDEMRALGLPAEAVETALLDCLAGVHLGRMLDIGTGTGRLLEFLATQIESGLGVDASRAMLALARVRLARPDLAHCSVRQADMYALPLPDAAFNSIFVQMVLHYAEDPRAVIREAARVLAPGGLLYVIDLAPHDQTMLGARMAHRVAGFDDAAMNHLFSAAGLHSLPGATVAGLLSVKIWPAIRPAHPTSPEVQA